MINTFSPADIRERGDVVMIVEDTEAATAIREAMMATGPKDF
jgi:hypothetical protein